MCSVRSHNKQRLLPYTTLAYWYCITEVESVYCAVRIESLYKTDTVSLYKGLNYERIACIGTVYSAIRNVNL
jgi:hypothetical protein